MLGLSLLQDNISTVDAETSELAIGDVNGDRRRIRTRRTIVGLQSEGCDAGIPRARGEDRLQTMVDQPNRAVLCVLTR